jgi:hypothetical protein
MRTARRLLGILLLAIGFLHPTTGFAVTLGQIDDFETGNSQGWGNGGGGAPPPNILTGGPSGPSDHYLSFSADGTTNQGGKLTLINSIQWAGNFSAAGVQAVSMDVTNEGPTPISLRIMLTNSLNRQPNGTTVVSTTPVTVPVGAGWIHAVFPIDPSHLTLSAGTNASAALTGAVEMRIFHSPVPAFPGPPVIAQLGLDNIKALRGPTANAGPPQTVPHGTLVQLNGTGSSDPDGLTPLTFAWQFVSLPVGSGAVLSDATSPTPTFTADVPGDYQVQLTVTNSIGVPSIAGPGAFVTISTTNSAPVANAGPDQAIVVGDTVTLDGSLSSDPDGDPITFQWSFSFRPPGSAATLNVLDPFHPTFVADLEGSYIVRLVVSDPWASSAPDIMTATTGNVQPLANAGNDKAAVVGATVVLDGSGSTDANNDPLTFLWSFTTTPAGSGATILDPAAAQTSFVPDVPGLYTAQLIVNDGLLASNPSTVTVTVDIGNAKPVARAGNGTTALVGLAVSLNGSGSTDPDGDPLTYLWSFATIPAGSAAVIADPTTVQTSFVPDVPGTYVVRLIVNDGIVDSDPSTVQILVNSDHQTAILQRLQRVEIMVGFIMNDSDFRNTRAKTSLLKKIDAVMAQVTKGRYKPAMKGLQKTVLATVDGCAVSGAPDRRDLIIDCTAQTFVYDEITAVISILALLL